MLQQIYPDANYLAANVNFSKTTLNPVMVPGNIGFCAAKSAIFLKKAFTKPNMAQTRPDDVVAGIIQSRNCRDYNGDPDAFNERVIDCAGLSYISTSTATNGYQAIKRISENAGHYYISLNEAEHAVAAINVGNSTFYYYDANCGLYQSNDAAAFTLGVMMNMGDNGYNTERTIWIYQVGN